MLVANFFNCNNADIDGTCSSVVGIGSTVLRPNGRLYGVFGFMRARFVFSISLIAVLVSRSSSDFRLCAWLVSDIAGNAFETRRTSDSGVL